MPADNHFYTRDMERLLREISQDESLSGETRVAAAYHLDEIERKRRAHEAAREAYTGAQVQAFDALKEAMKSRMRPCHQKRFDRLTLTTTTW